MFDHLPQKFRETILGAFREEGRRWLVSLPEIIKEIEENWSIAVKPPFPNLSYHYVAPCVFAGGSGEAVLKIGFPGEAVNILNEVKMLKFLGGRNAVRLLRFDEKRFAFLLEKLSPGENLKTICQKNNEARAVEIAIEVMRAFWQKPPEDNQFPRLEQWFRDFDKAAQTEFPSSYIKKASKFFDELTELKQDVLLHGDFHHENILSAARQPFLAIDPKGIIGEIGYDICIFMINHAHWLKSEPDLRGKLDAAIGKFSEAFKISPRNIRKWVFAHLVLSAWWTFEENCENWKDELAFAEIWEV
jgi:streptomycin 6-kinase